MGSVALIVDHPLRDLDGMVLTAGMLATRGHEVFLVPMYERHEVFLLRPTMVLVNYVRFANRDFIRACAKVGILVGVLDTEGGVVKDVDDFARRIANRLEGVSLYCTWGPRQLKALRAVAGEKVRIVATGCPRYDFAVPPWRLALRPPPLKTEGYVLVNTNFPIVNPRFQTAGRERFELITGMGYGREYVDRLIAEGLTARNLLTETVHALADVLPGVTIVIRPHPFEEGAYYREAFKNRPSVQVYQEGSVFDWLQRAIILIHHNCSTAVEAFLMGVPAVMPAWFNTPLLHQPTSAAVSLSADSPKELMSMVHETLNGRPIAVPARTVAAGKELIAEYFLANDGRAAERVAQVVDSILQTQAASPVMSNLRYALRVVCTHTRWVERASYSLLMTGGSCFHQRIRRHFRRSRTLTGKHFGVSDVLAILDRLRQADSVSMGRLWAEQVGSRRHEERGCLSAIRIAAA